MKLRKSLFASVILGAIGICGFVLAETMVLDRPLGLIEPDLPIGKPFTKGLVNLGKRLFFDRRLSASGQTSCGTCHDPHHAFADPRQVSISDNGIPQHRNGPSILNVGFLPTLMWDGRFRTLELQALDPFRKNGDMGIDLDELINFLVGDMEYLDLFQAVTGKPPTVNGFADSIAAFQRSLLSGNTRFDHYLFGGDKEALSPLEEEGLRVFSARAGCLNCHDVFHPMFNPLGGGIALFTDFRFHNLGVGYSNGRMSDTGRYYVTREKDDWGTFRTPSLRNIALTAPYMHDGSFMTLEEVIDFYDKGGIPNPNLSPSIQPLLLTSQEKLALLAFLHTLTDFTINQESNLTAN